MKQNTSVLIGLVGCTAVLDGETVVWNRHTIKIGIWCAHLYNTHPKLWRKNRGKMLV